MRVFAISDVHVDYKQNMDWLLSLSLTKSIETAAAAMCGVRATLFAR